MVKKKIIFSTHARIRSIQRGINEEIVHRVLNDPDYIRTTSDGRKSAFKLIGKKEYTVIYTEENNKVIVITVY